MTEMKIIHEDRPSQFFVLSDGVNYQLKWDDSRLTTHVKDISKADYEAYLSGKRSGADLMNMASYGEWPPTKEEYDESRRDSIRKTPIVLVNNPSSQELFSEAELIRLIPLAETAWIDWKGKLPDNYVSPIK